MSHNARQSLSALMDNEGDDLELRRVLATLEDAPDIADSWRRYHLVRSLMRRESGIDTTSDLSAGIMARLEQEPVPSKAHRESREGQEALRSPRDTRASVRPSVQPAVRRSLPLARSAGIAAAVSLMVIGGVQFYNGASPLGGESADFAASEAAGAPDSRRTPSVKAPSLVDLPMFQASPNARSGVMTVGAGAASPMLLTPSQEQQARMIDQQQALLLQSYLNRHAENAAASAGDTWLPLLRASGNEPQSQR